MIHDTASLIIRKDGRVLLIRRLNEPGKGCWAVPGGHVDEDESPSEAAQREGREEAGGIRVTGEAFVFRHAVGRGERAHPDKHIHKAHVFFAEPSGKIRAGSDAGDYRWFDPEEALGEDITGYTRTILKWLIANKR